MTRETARRTRTDSDPVLPTAFSVRVSLIDGSSVDLLLFQRHRDAEDHAAYIRQYAPLLGFRDLAVVERTLIGPAIVRR